MNTKNGLYYSSLVILTSFCLTACGGGGSEETTESNNTTAPVTSSVPNNADQTSNTSTSTTTTTSPTPEATSSQSRSSVPPALLPANAEIKEPTLSGQAKTDAFVWLNYFRQKLGLASVIENSQLADAASKQTVYVLTPLDSPKYCDRDHEQSSVSSAYYGTTVGDRTKKSGYSNSFVGEIYAVYGHGNTGETLQGLFDAIYHRVGMLRDYVNAGSAQHVAADKNICPDGNYATAVVFGEKAKNRTDNKLIAYPFNNQQDVPLDWYAYENPTPVPVFGALVGFPISLQSVDSSQSIRVDSAQLTNSQGQVIKTRLLSPSTDATLAQLGSFAMGIIPNEPMQPNETYNVSVKGEMSGTPMDVSWKFTTRRIIPVTISSSQGELINAKGTTKSTIISWDGGTGNFQPMMYNWINMNGPDGTMSSPVDLEQLSNNSWRITANGKCNIPENGTGCKIVIKVWDSSKPAITPASYGDPKNQPSAQYTLKVL